MYLNGEYLGSELVMEIEKSITKYDEYADTGVAVKPASEKVSTNFEFKKKKAYSFIKRLFDFLASLIMIVVLSPVFLIVMIVIALGDRKGKPIFTQLRCGKNGKTFKLYKFRTMRPDAEACLAELQSQNEMDGLVFKIRNDPRITKVGKFLRSTNIDELPQLVNILKGDMSFVGPRPPLPKEVEQYDDEDKLRLLVVPGLTCYWQVQKNRNDTSFKDWMQLDRKYITERSIFVDIKLMFKTFFMIFKRDGC